MRTKLLISVALLIGFGPLTTQASDWGIVLNGKAFHVDAAHDWNETNLGLGFEREFGAHSRWVKLAVGSGFVDSQNEMSYMAGGGLKRRFHVPSVGPDFYLDVGAVGFMMTRQDIDNNKPFPGILPTFTVGTRNFALNLAYLPGSAADQVAGIRNLDPDIDAIFFMQIKLSPRLFSPTTRRSRFNRFAYTD